MRKITNKVCGAFLERRAASQNSTTTDGKKLWLHGNLIAEWRGEELWITNAGWQTNTTKERLNGLGARIFQKDHKWYLGGRLWRGEWVAIRTHPEFGVMVKHELTSKTA